MGLFTSVGSWLESRFKCVAPGVARMFAPAIAGLTAIACIQAAAPAAAQEWWESIQGGGATNYGKSTSTSEKRSEISIAPIASPETPASFAIAPTKSPGRSESIRPAPTKSRTDSKPGPRGARSRRPSGGHRSWPRHERRSATDF